VPLKRETVARAALQVLDEVGLDGLTVRRLAAYLEIQNPSLYSHFTNKQELLNLMAELMIADAFAELHAPLQDQDWDEWLAEFARLFRRMMLGHRDGAQTLAEADVSLSKLAEGAELALTVLDDAGFDARSAAVGVVTIVHFVLGNTFEAQAEPSSLQSGDYEKTSNAPKPSIPSPDAERFPRTAAVLYASDPHSPAEASALFEDGLSLILDGLRATLARQRQTGTRGENS
jgi:TetR/AcrR family transcriptional regulator, tetracycline repressor protein